ncbi:MAG: histidine kinase [Clostridiaceae bacterium]|jgi:two-component system sensor histidine kinase YesM|nr:histidine kinase [Clostridiaceae bacterium]
MKTIHKPVRHSLRRRLILFILLIVTGLLIMLVMIYVQMEKEAKEYNHSLLDTYAENLEDVFNREFTEIMNNGITLSYNNTIIEGFMHYNEHGTMDQPMIQHLRATVDYVITHNKNIEDIIFYDLHTERFFSRQSYDEDIYSRWRIEESFGDKKITGAFYALNKESNTGYINSGPTFAYAIDVFCVNISGKNRIKLGTLVFVCNLNRSYDYLLNDETVSVEIHTPKVVLLSNTIRGKDDSATAPDKIIYKVEKTLKHTNWQMSVILNRKVSWLKDFNTVQFSFYMIMYLLASMIGIIILVRKNMHIPIQVLLNELSTIRPGDPSIRLSSSSSIEIDEICSYINSMLDRMDGLAEENLKNHLDMYELEISKKQAELIALRSQINPHFLYNTLECIRSIALSENITSIQEIAVAMASIFRYSIKGADTVLVSDEIAVIRDYFKVISIRHNGCYKLVVDIPKEMHSCLIPKMILQPIVENSIGHGLSRKTRGTVWVSGAYCEKSMQFEIRDNGVAMEREELEILRETLSNASVLDEQHKIGLLNICQRLRFAYGDSFQMEVFSEKSTGTSVRITLPYEVA